MNQPVDTDEKTDKLNQQLATEIALHPFVSGMSSQHLYALASQGVRMWYDKDQWLLREDKPANRFYLIQEGEVTLEAMMEERAPVLIQTLGAGDELGWSWLFPEHYFHFDARAIGPTRTIGFYGPALLDLCAKDHEFGYDITMRTPQALTKQLMAVRQKLVDAYRFP